MGKLVPSLINYSRRGCLKILSNETVKELLQVVTNQEQLQFAMFFYRVQFQLNTYSKFTYKHKLSYMKKWITNYKGSEHESCLVSFLLCFVILFNVGHNTKVAHIYLITIVIRRQDVGRQKTWVWQHWELGVAHGI